MLGWNPMAQTSLGATLWARLSATNASRHIRQHERPDIIHAHNALWGGEAARLVSERHTIPFVITEHHSHVLSGEMSQLERRVAKRAWNAANGVSAISDALASAVTDLSGRKPEVIPNPVDVDFFTLPPDGYATRQAPQFVTVANLNPNKRIDLLIRAFARLLRSVPDAQLEILGDGPERSRLVALTHANGSSDKIKFQRALDRGEVRSALWRSTCFVSTSRRETFGIAIAEALATGIPAIATRSGGPDEILRDDLGALVDRDDEDALVRAMSCRQSLAPTERARRRATIVERYSPDVVARQYIEMFQRVIETTNLPT
jgi:glycosyltransferase involved in cell wall biosynthesis